MDDNSLASIPGAKQASKSADSAAAGVEEPPSTTTSKATSSIPSILPTKKFQQKQASSATNSPIASRETSPVRPPLKATTSARSSGPGRSRKNSYDKSPPRLASTSTNPPSLAATQRALSVVSIPNLQPVVSEPTIKAPIPLKPSVATELKDAPRWPTSPRLRSPPPTSNKPSIVSPRKTEHDPPAINVQQIPDQESELQEGKGLTESEADDLLTPGMRTPARGGSGTSSTLETVQEISQPTTPALGLDSIIGNGEDDTPGTLSEKDNVMESAFNKATNKSKQNNESGSDSAGKGEIKMRAASVTPLTALRTAPPIKSYSSSNVAAGRGKPSAEGAQKMTVETETVSSIPAIALGAGAGGAGTNGSLRAKPSSETIRPKKEKKKTTRKAPSVSGTASSKADIFEAKVASAVDEANSSDSEETFVYESNPPDANDRPRRFHSRTPSATSMASQVDQRNGLRSMLDGGHSVAMKKSMKFANSYSSNGQDTTTGEDDGKGTARSNMGTGRGTTHHHHIGRWGRNGGNGHPSLFDNESPFPNAAKSKITSSPRNGSRPTSPKVGNNSRFTSNARKQTPISSGYDLEADDERTPLISTIRSGRSGRARRPVASSMRQMEHQTSRQRRSFLTRFAGCLVLTLMIVLVISGAVGFMFATTQPLTEVKVLALKNVLASEQELIVDMQVMAQNPNLVVVTIDSMDMLVFAKSKHAGTDSEWWKHPTNNRERRRRGNWQKRDDDPEDPPLDGDPNRNPNLEIGHVYAFESPLTFEGSPFHHSHSTSLGELRVYKPGNKTEPGGSERWGRVVQHEFDLIIRGSLKYTLPLSQKVRSIAVEGRVTVKPNAADQDPDTVHII